MSIVIPILNILDVLLSYAFHIVAILACIKYLRSK